MSQISFQPSFWDLQDPQEKLILRVITILGRLAVAVPWENFRQLLEIIFDKEGNTPVGRKLTDVQPIMFTLLLLQQSCQLQ